MDKPKIDKVLLPVSVEIQQSRQEKVRSEFWPKFKKFAAHIPFSEDLVASYYCATDRQTPFKVRGTLLAALAYFIMPLDFIPDILAMVGISDDIAVLSAAIALVGQHITDEHREKARCALQEDSHKKQSSD